MGRDVHAARTPRQRDSGLAGHSEQAAHTHWPRVTDPAPPLAASARHLIRATTEPEAGEHPAIRRHISEYPKGAEQRTCVNTDTRQDAGISRYTKSRPVAWRLPGTRRSDTVPAASMCRLLCVRHSSPPGSCQRAGSPEMIPSQYERFSDTRMPWLRRSSLTDAMACAFECTRRRRRRCGKTTAQGPSMERLSRAERISAMAGNRRADICRDGESTQEQQLRAQEWRRWHETELNIA